LTSVICAEIEGLEILGKNPHVES